MPSDHIEKRVLSVTSAEKDSPNKEIVLQLKNQKHLEVASHLYHFQISDMISMDRFDEKKGKKIGSIYNKFKNEVAILEVGGSHNPENLNPEDITIWEQLTSDAKDLMDDLTADVLDIMTLLWMQRAKTLDDEIPFHVEDALNIRGLQGRKNDNGYEMSHRKKDRNDIMKRMAVLGAMRIISDPKLFVEDDLGTLSYERLINISREQIAYQNGNLIGFYSCYIRPAKFLGEFLIGSKKVTSFFARKALEFDPYRRKYEKRLTRHLSWWWKIRLSSPKGEKALEQPYTIGGDKGLYQRMGLDQEENTLSPGKIKEKFETALERLVEHEIIKHWDYTEDYDETLTGIGRKGWFDYWLKQKVIITPTEELIQLYNEDAGESIEIDDSNQKKLAAFKEGLIDVNPELIQLIRTSLNLSYVQAAKQIGISRTMLARYEKKETKPQEKNLIKIKTWASTVLNG